MTRRLKMKKPSKSRVITFRVTEDEGERLDHYARVSGLSLSDYLRSMGRPSVVITGRSPDVTWNLRGPSMTWNKPEDPYL